VIVLSIMILRRLPRSLVARWWRCFQAADGCYGLGATRWETILAVTAPSASRAFSVAWCSRSDRALGETMRWRCCWEPECDQYLVVLASQHTGRPAGERVPGGRPKDVARLMYAATVLLAITLVVNGRGLHHTEYFR